MQVPTWIAAGLGAAPFLAALGWLLTHPEIAEKWASLLGRLGSKIPGLYRRGTRAYVKHDTQRRINSFTKRLAAEGDVLTYEKAEVHWVDEDADVEALAAAGKVILRLSAQQQQDRGFLRGAYMFVATSLLSAAKRPLSGAQRAGLDIFVTRSLVRREHPDLLEVFDEEVLGPEAVANAAETFERLSLLESRGLMWDVFLQELQRLGDDSTFSPERGMREGDVEELLDFLCGRARRPIGELVECEYLSDVFRLALVYVGLRDKVEEGPEVWVRYINGRLATLSPHSVYLIATEARSDLTRRIVEGVGDAYIEKHASARSYWVVKGGELQEISGHIRALVAIRPRVPSSAGVLSGINDNSEIERAAPPRQFAELRAEEVPEGLIDVVVIGVRDSFGFLAVDGMPDVYFKLEQVHSLALPVTLGQTGRAELVLGGDGKVFAKQVRLEPQGIPWRGLVTGYGGGFGRIRLPDGSTDCRFQIKDWLDSTPVRDGISVSFVPVLTSAGHYRARQVVRAPD